MRRTRGEGCLRAGPEADVFAEGFLVVFEGGLEEGLPGVFVEGFEEGLAGVFAEGFDSVSLVAELSAPC
jgi:hypothetical protein